MLVVLDFSSGGVVVRFIKLSDELFKRLIASMYVLMPPPPAYEKVKGKQKCVQGGGTP